MNILNPYQADHDYCRFYSALIFDQLTVIGDEICIKLERNTKAALRYRQSAISNFI